MNRTFFLWFSVAIIGYCLFPWYILEDGFFSFEWLFDGYPTDTDYAPAISLIWQGEKPWLALILPCLLLPIIGPLLRLNRRACGYLLLIAGGLGLLLLLGQGFAIGIRGWSFGWLNESFGELGDRQFGFGYGAMLTGLALLFYLTTGLATLGAVNGDRFVVGSVGLIVTMVTLFILFPVLNMLASAIQDNEGHYSLGIFLSLIHI